MGKATAWWAAGKNAKNLSDNTGTNRKTRVKEKVATSWNGKWNIKKGYRTLDVRLPEQFSIIGKLRARYPVSTLCNVFEVHRSSYKYWKNRPENPDGRQTVLWSQLLEVHGISHGSAGARSIATMATQRGYRIGRWLAGRLMKDWGWSVASNRLTDINVVAIRRLHRQTAHDNVVHSAG